ncbi:cell wall protein Ecm33p [Monosporozyma servazzii]
MQFKSTVLALLATSTAAFAATSTTKSADPCSIGSKATATAQTDLDVFASCKTITGNLTITGELGSGAIANVQKIDGSLIIKNATQLVSFSADSISEITGSLELTDLTILTTASFGSLEKVNSINLITLPAISTFNSKLSSADNIYISDTTLESVDGFSVLSKVSTFNINNNRFLTSIQSSLKTVSDALSFQFNGDNATITLDELIWANNITLSDVSSASFNNLQSVNASLAFLNNSLESIKLNNLSNVGQTFTIAYNDELTDLELGQLTKVGGGLVVANNTNLIKIDAFKKLQSIGGALNVLGKFGVLDLKSLKSVRGAADVETTSSNFSCSALKTLQKKGAIQGDKFVCKTGHKSSSKKVSSVSSEHKAKSTSTSTSSSASNTDSASASSSSSSSKSKGLAVANVVESTSVFGVFAAVVAALL